ncbi:hypothetical protein ABZ511_30420 [Nocardia gamkensis]|uniref:hypothetical protein n=1 Tax=Nocardia gamkensis TaxID=352869 RepID=UPI0033EFAD9C
MTLQLDPTTSAPPSSPVEATGDSPAPFTRRLLGLVRASSGLILAVGIWQLGARSWLGKVVSAPTEVLESGWELIRSGELWQRRAASGRRVAIGPAIGIGLVWRPDCSGSPRIWSTLDITVARSRSVVDSAFSALRRRLLLALGVNPEAPIGADA